MNSAAIRVLCLVILSLSLTGVAHAAGILRIGAPTVEGDQVTIPVQLDGEMDNGVASLNFDFNYDPAVLEPVAATPGAAATAANKQVQSNTVTPGDFRVVMMGLNQSTVRAGEIANIVMRKVGTPAGGEANLSIDKTTFASASGVEIPSQGSTGKVRLETGEEETTEEEPAETAPEPEPADDEPAAKEPAQEPTSRAATKPDLPVARRDDATPTTGPETAAPASTSSATPSAPSAATSAARETIAKGLQQADQTRATIIAQAVPGTPGAPAGAPPQTPQTGGPTVAGAPAAEPMSTASQPKGGVVPVPTGESTTMSPSMPAASVSASGKDKSGSPTTENVAAVATGAPQEAASSGSHTKFIVLAVVIVALVGVFVLRKKLFA
ncbi:MAG: hypothetical protein HY706_06430 [Candidatus Hydrogenedentes bacterium]|nr:hypothetical protein [Candidatus Hydrogenedentota bacterium]